MPREYSPYAIFETTFLLSDHRYKSLRAASKVAYIALWARAFHERRETLPTWYGVEGIREDARLDPRTTRKALEELQQKCLIEVHDDGSITVLGVKEKGGKIHWKEGQQTAPQTTKKVSKKRREEKRRVKKRREEDPDITEIVLYLNEKAGREFQTNCDETISLLNARLKKFSKDDLKKVIDFKVQAWKGDPKMDQYLQPSTLFGKKKVEGYVQASKAVYTDDAQYQKDLQAIFDGVEEEDPL